MQTVFTFGYGRRNIHELRTALESHDARLIDIRYSPKSMRPEWNQEQLREAFGDRYLHVPALGNRNYGGRGPIALAAPDAGVRIVAPILERQAVILLCQCPDWRECHRAVAADLLAEKLGAPVEHLEPGSETKRGSIKVITLTQPWATLVAVGAKQFETRSWSTNYRGPLAIHAGKGLGDLSKHDFEELCNDDPFYDALAKGLAAGLQSGPGMFNSRTYFDPNALPRGAIIAVCDLVDCIPAGGLGVGEKEKAFGNFAPGRYAWLLENVRRLREPLPARGALGLWDHEWASIEALLEGDK
jgi:hypothetical protein